MLWPVGLGRAVTLALVCALSVPRLSVTVKVTPYEPLLSARKEVVAMDVDAGNVAALPMGFVESPHL